LRILGVKPVTFLIAVVLILLASSLSQAYGTPVEIAYDNGVHFGNNALRFAGVMFSLPTGVTSARLLTVRFYWIDAGDPVTVHITASDHVTELTTPIPTTGTATVFQDLDVSGLGIVVTGDFFVFLENPGGCLCNFGVDSSPSVGRSYYSGTTLAAIIPYPTNNILLRVVVDPIPPPTTTTTTVPPPAVHPLNVGGEMFPVNLLQVLGPWVAAMLALTVVAVETLVIRKKKNRKP